MADGTCAALDCERPRKCQGWCAGHWARVRRHGDPQEHIPFRVAPTPGGASCSIAGCERPLRGERLCNTHQYRLHKYGDPLAHVPIRPKTSPIRVCSIDGCARDTVAHGWCRKHYIRWYIHDDPLTYLYGQPKRPCAVDDCTKPVQSLGWCRTHYSRWQNHGDVQAHIPVRPIWGPDDRCLEDGCADRVHIRGWCERHYDAVRRHEIRTDPVLARKARNARQRYYAAAKSRDPELLRRKSREWRLKNPDLYRLHHQRKWQRRNAAPTAKFTASQVVQRMAYWGGRCWICRGPFEAIDHVKPLSKGGWHVPANMRPACKPCNSAKKDKWPFPVGR